MEKEKQKNKWATVIKVILVLFIVAFIISWGLSFFMSADYREGNVAIIPISGVIMPESQDVFGSDVASAKSIVGFIKEADDNPNIKAIILEINSPGGAPVSTEEITNAIRGVNKTIISYIREVGASGAYWIAASTEYIFASRMSTMGSVGVIASYLEISGLLRDYNVTYQRLVAGKYKDIGTPFKPLTINEEEILQKQLDEIHKYFIEDIAKRRKLSEEAVKEVETARIFLGVEAKEIGLIDEFGGREEAIKYVEEKLNITAEPTEFVEKITLIDVLSQVMSRNSFFIGKGIGSSLLEARNTPTLKLWT